MKISSYFFLLCPKDPANRTFAKIHWLG